MSRHRLLGGLAATALTVGGLGAFPVAQATAAATIGDCQASFDVATQTYTLTQNCSTFDTITVPDGDTLDGAGHTITAVEDDTHPNFPGPIVTSATGTDAAGATMSVKNLTIETRGFLGPAKDSGGNLAGIKFDRSGGSVNNVIVGGVSHGNGVQEGIGIWVRNRGLTDVPSVAIRINNVTVRRYQMAGIVLDGNIVFALSHSIVGQSKGPGGQAIPDIGANAVQVSRTAHGNVRQNRIALNDYDPNPAPGDGSDATGILLYNAKRVKLWNNVITGADGDVGIDVSNDSQGLINTRVYAFCNLVQRTTPLEAGELYDYGLAVWSSVIPNGGGASFSAPTVMQLSDNTFDGWRQATATPTQDGTTLAVSATPGPDNPSLGLCPPSAPTHVATSGGNLRSDVTWTPAQAPNYTPVTGYTVSLRGGGQTQVQHLAADATRANFIKLERGVDYRVTVRAVSSGGSASASRTLHKTALTLSRARGRVVYGSMTTLRGVLSSSNPAAVLDGRRIRIDARPAGATSWRRVGPASVGSDGSFRRRVKPAKNTQYRAFYAGVPDLSSLSKVVTVKVAARVWLALSSTSVRRGTTVKLSGTVGPNLAGRAVYLQHWVSGQWRTVAQHRLSSDSGYVFRFRSQRVGSSTWRVVIRSTPGFAQGASRTVTVTTR